MGGKGLQNRDTEVEKQKDLESLMLQVQHVE